MVKRTVLLVEDEAMLRDVFTMALEDAGFQVVAAADSPEAANILRGPAPINLLITDVMLPGDSGINLAKSLRDREPHIPIMIISGNNPESYESHLPGLRPCASLAKPFTLTTLIQTANSLLS
jgi:CheY-like chemotaxis protein